MTTSKERLETMGPPSKHSCSWVLALSNKGFVPGKCIYPRWRRQGVGWNYGNSWTEAWMSAEPSTLLSLHKQLGQVLEYVGPWGNDSLANNKNFPLWIRRWLTTNTAHHLQLQLNKFHTFTTLKGLTLDVHKTKTTAFFCSNPPVLCYNGTARIQIPGHDPQPQWEDDKCLKPDAHNFAILLVP